MVNNRKYKYIFYLLDVGYIGSTRKKKFSKRIDLHRHFCYNLNSRNFNIPLYKHIRKHHPGYNFESHNIVILDEVTGLTEAQALAVEQEYINQLKPELNKIAAKRLISDNEYSKQKITCSCGAISNKNNIARHLKTKRHKTNIQEITNTLNEYYKTSEDKHHCTLKHNEKFK